MVKASTFDICPRKLAFGVFAGPSAGEWARSWTMRQSDSGQMTVEWPERSFISILELESFVQVKEVAISPGRKMKTVQKPTKKVHICNLFNVPLNSVPHASQAACNTLMICSLNTIIYYSYSYILNVMLQFYTGLFTHTLSV